MEWTWKKTLGVCLFFIVLIVGPIFLVSNPMMDFWQKRCDKNPNSDTSKWLQMKMANWCYDTGRPERAAEYYRKFLERYPTDPQRPYALMRYGQSLEDSNRNADAIAVYEQYVEEYPEREDKQKALQAIDRIKYVKPK